MGLIYDACLEMATETACIERVFTTSTVAGKQEYDWPTNATTIKRITVNGQKLIPITFRDDDALTLLNSAVQDSGQPQYYTVWEEVFALRPIPASVQDIKVYATVEPQEVTDTSTLEIPTAFHNSILHYVVAEMAAKDENFTTAQYYQAKWVQGIGRMKRFMKKMKRGDSFASVQDEGSLPSTILGAV